MSQRHIFSWIMVNPSLLLVLLQSQTYEPGHEACVFGFIFSVQPSRPFCNRASQSCLVVCMTPCLMEMELLIRALWQAKQSLVGSRRFGIPPISGPKDKKLEIDWS